MNRLRGWADSRIWDEDSSGGQGRNSRQWLDELGRMGKQGPKNGNLAWMGDPVSVGVLLACFSCFGVVCGFEEVRSEGEKLAHWR